MKNKYALYPIAMSFVSLLCFILVLFIFKNEVQPLWGRIALLALPSVVFLLVSAFAVKGKLGKSKTVNLTTLLSFVLLIISALYFFVLCFMQMTTQTTDVRYYSRAYEAVADEDGAELFPKTIPDDASDVSFVYHPQFLQGSEVFSLSYTETENKIAEWKNTLKDKAEWIGPKQDRHAANDISENATLYQLYWNGEFNHSEICYVAIDEDACRITFYYSRG